MTDYVIKVILCQVILYLFYYFFLAREKTHKVNRLYLVFALFFSVIVPMIKIPAYFPTAINFSSIVLVDQDLELVTNKSNSESVFNFQLSRWLIIFYLLILLFFITRMIRSLFRINLVAMVHEKIGYKGFDLILTDRSILPYSFLNRIYVNRQDYVNGKIGDELLAHEICHIQQRHSVDIIIIEIVQALFWFNPVLILYNKAIRLNHEYLADQAVIRNEIELGSYQKILVESVAENNLMPITSGFSATWTKKRLLMMAKNSSVFSSSIRLLVAIPVLFLLTASFIFSGADEELIYQRRIASIFNKYPNLYGTWEGSGRFNNTNLHAEVGYVDLRVVIHEDKTIEGTIGNAVFSDANMIKRRYGVEMQAHLSQPVKDNDKIDKKCLILLWGLPEIEENKADVNFHLQNNFFLDFYLNVGGAILTKVEDK